MRTTLTLDEDVAARLKAAVRRTGRPFKQVVNESLRTALAAQEKPLSVRPFKVKARPLHPRPGLNFDNIGELLEQLEGPFHR